MSKDYNYPDKTPASKPDVIVNVYGRFPPKAAEFGVGVSTTEGCANAADAVRQKSNELSRRPTPSSK